MSSSSFGLFGCCGPPPHATIKAYDNTTPFALDWYDDRDAGTGGVRETAIIDWNDETGFTTGVLSYGSGSEITGSTKEKAIVERVASTGARQTESTSTPLTAPTLGVVSSSGMTLQKTTAVSGPFGGSWLTIHGTADTRCAFFDLDLIQQSAIQIIKPSVFSFNNDTDAGLSASQELVLGYGRSNTTLPSSYTTVARRYNYSGTLLATANIGVLSTTGVTGYGVVMDRSDTVDEMVIVYNKSGSRHVAVLSKSGFALLRSGTTSGTNFLVPNIGAMSTLPNSHNRRINNSHMAINLTNGNLSGWELTTPSESWVKSDKVRQVVTIDSSNVYTVNPTTGELSCLDVSTGNEQWTLDLSAGTKLGTGSGQTYGTILSSGNIAVWRNAGVTIVNTSGTEIATVDVGPCYGIVEKSNRWIIVGAKRTTAS